MELLGKQSLPKVHNLKGKFSDSGKKFKETVYQDCLHSNFQLMSTKVVHTNLKGLSSKIVFRLVKGTVSQVSVQWTGVVCWDEGAGIY